MTKPLALIVEDDPTLSQIFSISLQAYFAIEAIDDGLAAINRLPHVQPNLVVLDLNLPGASGREVLAKIRADARLASTKVILATADERQAELLENEADIVLLKPVSPGQLRELAARLV